MMDNDKCEQFSKEFAELKVYVEMLTTRIADIESTTKSVHELATSVAVLCEQMKHMNEGINTLNTQMNRFEQRVDAMEAAPGRGYESIKSKVITVIVEAIVAMIMAGVVWAVMHSGV